MTDNVGCSGAESAGSAGSGGTPGSAGVAEIGGASSTAGASSTVGAGGGSSGSGGAAGSGGTLDSAGAGAGVVAFATWPGQNQVATVDDAGIFVGNLSGLFYEPASGSAPTALWAILSAPATLYRLLWDGTVWTPDTSDTWTAGKSIVYTDGMGSPDSEGVTKAAAGSAGVYVACGHDNDNSGVPRLSVLLYDDTAAGDTLTASMEWDLTREFQLPVGDANLGLKAIAWVPDTYLVAKGFFDEGFGTPYDPAMHPNHAAGIFFVGLAENGGIYGYALNHTDGSYTRVATISSGNPSIAELSFDRDVGYLWAVCNDTCNGRSNVLDIDTRAGSPTLGKFYIRQGFERPSTLGNFDNEGFAIAPESSCVNGFKDVFYADDGNDANHSIRADSIPCGPFLP